MNQTELKELVARKVQLQACILGYEMWNKYGKSPEDLGEQMMMDINNRKELFAIEQKIQNYVEAV